MSFGKMNKFIEIRFGQADLGRSIGLHKNDVEEGEYFYTYLEDEQEMKDTETFIGQPFDYAFPLRDCDEWVGLVKVEDWNKTFDLLTKVESTI
mgnify:CR=1 FL=1